MSAPAFIPDRQLPVAGEGPMLYPEIFPQSTGPAYPAAATLCRLAAASLGRGETVADDGAVAARRHRAAGPAAAGAAVPAASGRPRAGRAETGDAVTAGGRGPDAAREAAGEAADRPAGAGKAARLRPMATADLADVIALEHELFPEDPWTPEMFADEVAQPPEVRLYLVAEDDPDARVGGRNGRRPRPRRPPRHRGVRGDAVRSRRPRRPTC